MNKPFSTEVRIEELRLLARYNILNEYSTVKYELGNYAIPTTHFLDKHLCSGCLIKIQEQFHVCHG